MSRIRPECMPRGERNGNSKLTADDVRAIRASGDDRHSCARTFGVTATLVSMIRKRKIWRHLD